MGQDSRLGLGANLCPLQGCGQGVGWGCCHREARLGQGLLPCSLTWPWALSAPGNWWLEMSVPFHVSLSKWQLRTWLLVWERETTRWIQSFFFYNLTWKKHSIARPCPILSNRSKSPNLAYTQGEEITQGVSALRALRAVSAAKGGQR